jgi:hypothetical protein
MRWKNIIISNYIFVVEMGTWKFDRVGAEDPQQGHQLVVCNCITECLSKNINDRSKRIEKRDQREST